MMVSHFPLPVYTVFLSQMMPKIRNNILQVISEAYSSVWYALIHMNTITEVSNIPERINLHKLLIGYCIYSFPLETFWKSITRTKQRFIYFSNAFFAISHSSMIMTFVQYWKSITADIDLLFHQKAFFFITAELVVSELASE